MKYFTKEWYINKQQGINEREYYQYIEDNYEYYPNWFKEFNIVETGAFIFHDALICDVVEENNKLIINMIGIANKGNIEYNLILEDTKKIETPERVCDTYIIAEEIYCSKEKSEIHFLLLYDLEPFSPMNFTVEFKRACIEYVKEPLLLRFKLFVADFYRYFSKESRAKRKIEEKEKS